MSNTQYTHLVIARIPEYIEPIDRGERYEDPLNDILEKATLGKVTGGGSQLDEQFRIVFVDIEMQLANLDGAVSLVKESLASLGCPAGTELQFEEGGASKSVACGNLEALEIYFDGVNLPETVYAECDFQEIYRAVAETLEARDAGEPRGVWNGPEEVGLYLYGPCARKMSEAVEGLAPRFSLFQNARMVFRMKDPAASLPEKRLPMGLR